MFGLLLTVLSGGWFGKWLDENLGGLSSDSQIKNLVSSNVLFVNQINEDVFNDVVEFLMIYEGFMPVAKVLRGEGRATVGYGTTNWLTSSGKIIRPVRAGETITKSEALLQLKYFFVPVLSNVRVYMAQNNIAVNSRLLAALMNFCYMSGIGFMTKGFVKEILFYANRNPNTEMISDKMRDNIVRWWKVIKNSQTGVPIWPINKLGYTRRMRAAEDYLKGNLKHRSWYDRNIKVPY